MNLESEYIPAGLHGGKMAVERAIEISKNLIAAELKY